MRKIYEDESKDTFQRIIELQVESMIRKFCLIMDKYYRSIITHRDTCKQRIQRQYHIGKISLPLEFIVHICSSSGSDKNRWRNRRNS